MKTKINWQAEDGYVSGSRPQHTTIDYDEFFSDLSREEVVQLIEELIEEDFRQKVHFSINEDEMDRVVDEIMEYIKEEDAEEEQ